ncbi:hypothetical protein Hanom_Chr06g00517061 [Helianthus anomalus]
MHWSPITHPKPPAGNTTPIICLILTVENLKIPMETVFEATCIAPAGEIDWISKEDGGGYIGCDMVGKWRLEET